MKIAIVGLGKMGAQIAQKWIAHGHQVVALDPNEAARQGAAEFGAEIASDRADAVSRFGDEPVSVWLMIPAQLVGDEVAAWLEVLPGGSVLIDGGNTDFRLTQQHAAAAGEKAVTFLDVGVSGGILGTEQGFSLMVGGDEAAYQQITPLLDALGEPRGGHAFFGEVGSGHYVKMVHNAIEYGMMESLAEGYEMLKQGPFHELDLAKASAIWQRASVIESTLNGLAAEIMAADQNLTEASGYVAESGEGRWTLEIAQQAGIQLPAVQAALDVRLRSEQGQVSYATKLLAELRNKFGGHRLNK